MDTDEIMIIFESHYKEMVQFDKYLGMELDVAGPGNVSYTLKLGEQHLTAPDLVHGGVAAAMMDSSLGLAALSYAVTKGNLCATVEFKINYLRQGRPGSTLVATGKVKNTGKRLIVCQADIVEKESGQVVATGLGTFTQYPADRRDSIRSTVEEHAGKLDS